MMKKTEMTALLSRIDELTALMEEYNECTDRMVTSDLEIISRVLLSRNDIIENMKKTKASVMQVVDSLAEDEQILVKRIMNNSPVPSSELAPDMRKLQSKMKRLHSIKAEVDQKDRKVGGFIYQSFEDVKTELESLKTDKKRIDLYNNVKLGGKGKTFSTNS